MDVAELFVTVRAKTDSLQGDIAGAATEAGAAGGEAIATGISEGGTAGAAEAAAALQEGIVGGATSAGTEGGAALGEGLIAGGTEGGAAAGAAAGEGIAAGVQGGVVDATGSLSELSVAAGAAGAEGGAAAGEGIATGVAAGAGKAKESIVGIKEALAAIVFADFLKDAIQNAEKLETTMSRITSVFGDSKSKLEDFSKDAADKLGVSEQAALQAEAQFGNLGKTAGLTGQDLIDFSQNLTTLTSNLSAFSGNDFASTADSLSKATEGMTRGLKAYGVQISNVDIQNEAVREGLINQGAALTDSARIIASYNLILQSTGQYTDYFAQHTQDAAEAQKIAAAKAEDTSASIGEALLPAYKKVLEVITFLIDGFSQLPGPVQTAVVAMAGLAILAGPISKLVTLMGSLAGAIGDVAKATIGFAVANPEILALVAVAAAATAAFLIFGNQESAAEKEGRAMATAMITAAQGIDKQGLSAANATTATQKYGAAIQDVLTKQLMSTIQNHNQVDDLGRIGETYQSLSGLTGTQAQREAELVKVRGDLIDKGEVYIASTSDATKAVSLSATEQARLRQEYVNTGTVQGEVVDGQRLVIAGNTGLQKTFEDTANATGIATQKLVDATIAGDANAAAALKASGAWDLLTPAQQKAADTLLQTAGAAGTAKDAVSALDGTTSDAASTADVYQEHLSTLTQKFDDAANASNALKDALDKLVGVKLDLDEATSKAIEKEQDIATAFKNNGKTLDEYTQKGRDNRKAVDDSAKAELDYLNTFVQNGGTIDDARTKLEQYTGRLHDQLRASGLSEAAVQDYINTLGLTPDNINTAITLTGQEQAKADVQAHLNDLAQIPPDKKTEIQTLIDQGQYSQAQQEIDQLTQARTLAIHLAVDNANVLGAGILGHTTVQSASGRLVTSPLLSTLGELGPEAVINGEQAVKVLWAIANGQQQTKEATGSSGAPISITTNIGNVYGVDDLDAKLDARDRALVTALGAR